MPTRRSRLWALRARVGLFAAALTGCTTLTGPPYLDAPPSVFRFDAGHGALRQEEPSLVHADAGDAVDVAGVTAVSSPRAAALEEEMLFLTNAARRAVGVDAVVRVASLDEYARAHAHALASAGHLHHTDIAALLGPWRIVGENVGVGPTLPAIQAAYEASPTHHENVVEPAFTAVGVGVHVDAAGRLWTAQAYSG